ncbi:DUF5367 family protein [Geobacillus sp. E263]|uniref:DUF5367 family protein n=1 Tax=Geobacillus sp. E263 TaxID=391290 RepID=UPI00117A4D4F|nr:DUF5367 family protein [Geobacillus sp. E263]
MYFFIWGFLVWLGATLIFRLFGHFFFNPENALLLLLSYLLVVPLIFLLTYPLYKLKGLTKDERLKAAIFIVLPGMFIDTIVLVVFTDVFTNLPVESDRYFGSWLLWAYGLILITGLPLKKRERNDNK